LLGITKKSTGNITLISITGNLMLNNIESLDNVFKEVMETKPAIIGLDCHKLNSLDSSGLSLFLRFQKDSD
jgi:anti-anti-sigma factor